MLSGILSCTRWDDFTTGRLMDDAFLRRIPMETRFTTFAEVIEFAAMREEEAHAFYKDLAEKTDDPYLKQLFSDFAAEELKHKNRLIDIDKGGVERIFKKIIEKVNDLHVVENINDVEPGPEMAFQDALVLAMKREDKSNHLYSLLAELAEDNDISLLFLGLSQEEARHRLRLETAYKNLFMPLE